MIREQLECHKNCESQRLQLKRKIEELQKGNASNSSLNRITSESPAPFKKAKRSLETDIVDSPTVVCFVCFFNK